MDLESDINYWIEVGEDVMNRRGRGLEEVWPTSKKIQAKHK